MNQAARQGAARVFISSTVDDLEAYRARAREAAVAAGLLPVMSEDFTASGKRAPLAECLARVGGCDVLVVLAAHRYGWKPEGRRGKSITWLECEAAVGRGMEVLAFLVDDKCEWPAHLKDSHQVAAALETGSATTALLEEVQRDIAKLGEFKRWLNGRGIRSTFSTPEELHRKVEAALREWRSRHVELAGGAAAQDAGPADPSVYLAQLREECSWIDIRGLQVGTGKAHRFPIGELYIPLTMAGAAVKPGRSGELMERTAVPLEEALANARLVVVGDPGSGKSTFLRHVALERVNELERGEAGAPFPILIRISELVEHIRRQLGSRRQDDSPGWIAGFLAARSEELNQGLDERFFEGKLKGGPSMLLLDGLDEAPGAREREAMVRLFENATRAWRALRFVVTTRPLSYHGRGVLAGFETARIEPLETAAIETFLDHWCRALFPESEAAAKRHLGELSEALRGVPEIRRMARTPVMLTALAAVHWNERRLPEQRADLYESILNWLARSRERRAGRLAAERCLTLLQGLALEMQRHPGGRQAEVEKGWAADALVGRFEGATEGERREAALWFVEEEEVDSGILVSRGAAVRFWHLTFQEYLAARAIAGLGEADQRKLLLGEDRIYRPEWRETALLLAGVLRVRQGAAKVDGLFAAVLDRLGSRAPLAAKARCAGLLGAMVNDLRPLDYQPADRRYKELMDAVLGIFDREKSAGVEFAVRLEAAEALGQAGDPRLARDNWVRIGDAFEIGRYPVTVAEYRRFVESNGYGEERWWKAGGFGREETPDEWEEQQAHPNRPVAGVSWYEASAYCSWAGGRLPRDAEWLRAARGPEGREYPWGNEEPDVTRADYWESGPHHATPVGLYPAGATPEGVLDLAGNVWEWVEDRFAERGEARMVGGGCFFDVVGGLRAANRLGFQPDERDRYVGLRCVRDLVR